MPWIALCAALAAMGLAVLSILTARVFVRVRGLGQEVERSRRRLEPQLAALEEASARMNAWQRSDVDGGSEEATDSVPGRRPGDAARGGRKRLSRN